MPTVAPSGRLANLPTPLTPLLGRERELASVVALLRDPAVRLLTLTGPGGVGKTRLALRLAADLEDEFADGAAFVPLAPVRDPALVAPAIAQALAVREAADRPLVETLATALGSRRLLLVLDNLEHLLPAAPLLADLLAACPRLTVLATSRATLRLSGEHLVRVPPLALPDPAHAASAEAVGAAAAVRLFVSRARAARDDFALTEANAPVVAAICGRLDGLPLALELAAVRTRHLPPATLLAHLEQRLPLLTGGPHDLPVRQRTLRDAIAWSHDLLPPAEQTLFARLAVFVGGCTLEAAAAVATAGESPGSEVLDGIASLVDKSLLQQGEGPDGAPRYAMLETVREFAMERLAASGAEVVIRDAHLAWFVAFAERAKATVHGPRAAARIGRLNAEHANLRAALEWSVEQGHGEAALRLGGALQDFWYLGGHLREGRRWLEAAVAIGAGAPPHRRARALLGLGWLAHFQGDAERAADALGQSLTLYRELGDRLGTGNALNLLGIAEEDRGAYDAAAPLFAEARACFEEVGDRSLVSQAVYHLGLIALGQGDLDQASERFAEAERLARAEGDDFNLAAALCYHGLVHCARGALARAADALEEALALDRAAGNREGVAIDVAGLAVLAAAAGRPDAAARLLGAAGGLCDRLGLRPFALPERVAYDRALATARDLLGEPAFAAAWAEGQARTLDAESAADVEAVLAATRPPSATAKPPDPAHDHGLTPRELDVLRLLVAGRSNPEIAAALFVSPRTVTTHVEHIFAKLGVSSRAEAAALAARRGHGGPPTPRRPEPPQQPT
jgi:predicted ATPase/DNA-binding CsgD family transcriptional regulator